MDKFLDYSNHNCVSDAYQDFVTKLLPAVGFVSPIRTLRVKSHTKPWLDKDALNAIRNSDKPYKDSNNQAKFSLKKIINNKPFEKEETIFNIIKREWYSLL